MGLRAELEKVLHNVGPENIWRPVYDNENMLLADGVADKCDTQDISISKVDFHGKTVLDLGCNFGFFSFLAKQLGARKVLGIDSNAQIIKGCQLLKAMHKVQDVHFYMADFVNSDLPGPFDIGMLIGYIGKQRVRKRMTKLLDVVERVSQSAMIIDLLSAYHIGTHLDGDAENFLSLYPPAYIRDGKFHLIEFVHDYFHSNWHMSVISPEYDRPYVRKTLFFTRK